MWAINLFFKNKLIAHIFNKDYENTLITIVLSSVIVVGIICS
jgi:hypothetical protein